MKTDSVALLVIDVQLGMFESPLIPPVNEGKRLLGTIGELIVRARSLEIPVAYIQHCGGTGHPLERGSTGWVIHPAIQPRNGDLVIRKKFCDSFLKTKLHESLQKKEITKLVVVGIQTEFCVDTACRRAFSLGYEVTLVEDGHSTWDTDALKAPQIVARHNRTLSSSFVKLQKAEVLFRSKRPVMAQ